MAIIGFNDANDSGAYVEVNVPFDPDAGHRPNDLTRATTFIEAIQGQNYSVTANSLSIVVRDQVERVLESLPDGALPMKTSSFTAFGPSSLFEDDDQVLSAKPTELPPAFLSLGDSQILGAGDRILTARNGRNEMTYLQTLRLDTNGTAAPFFYRMGAETAGLTANVFDSVLTDPQTLEITSIQDVATTQFFIRPATAGTLLIESFVSSATGAARVFSRSVEITQSMVDAGTEIDASAINPSLVLTGDVNYLVFSGIQLRGGLQTATGVNGQTTPYFRTVIRPVTLVDYITDDNVLSKLAALGITPNGSIDSPMIRDFTITGQAARIAPDTEISGSRTFTYRIVDPADVTGPLELVEIFNGVENVLDSNVLASSTSTTATITTRTLAAGQSVTYTLRRTAQNLSASFTITANQLHELAYAYTSTSITAGTKTLTDSDVQSFDVTAASGSFQLSLSLANSEYLIIEFPDNRPITAIEVPPFGNADLADFPLQNDVRTIGSVSYDARTHLNNGPDGTVNYTIRY